MTMFFNAVGCMLVCLDDKKMHPSVMSVATSTIVDIPVHAISYTSADKHNKRIFAFVANSKEKNVMQCYVFESKRAKVQCDAIKHSFVVSASPHTTAATVGCTMHTVIMSAQKLTSACVGR